MTDDLNPKTIAGLTKPPLHLVPSTAMIHTAMAFALGAEKYGPYNWREKAVPASIYIAAAERHLRAWFDGQDLDEESRAHHLGHAMACMAIILDAMEIGKLIDDRPPCAPTADVIKRLTKVAAVVRNVDAEIKNTITADKIPAPASRFGGLA